jgi:NAD-dependent dihydropyrimidine dehydrogenase PreA subunit
MTYVITEPCVGTLDASCAEVCPVDCIHPAPGEAVRAIDPAWRE